MTPKPRDSWGITRGERRLALVQRLRLKNIALVHKRCVLVKAGNWLSSIWSEKWKEECEMHCMEAVSGRNGWTQPFRFLVATVFLFVRGVECCPCAYDPYPWDHSFPIPLRNSFYPFVADRI